MPGQTAGAPRPDAGMLIGMSLAGEHEIERAADFVAQHGFEAMEVFHGQIGPALLPVKVTATHAAWVGAVVRAAGLTVSTLNCAGHPGFQPLDGLDAERSSAALLAEHLRWAAAMRAPRVLIWDGIARDPATLDRAPEMLAGVIARARDESGLTDAPDVSIELHPFTFALEQRRLEELAAAVTQVGAGICLDICHFGVALGPGFIDELSDTVLDAVNHVHYSDTDCVTSEFHMPPGLGVIDLARVGQRLAGRDLSIAWDLFCWPGPDRAITEYLPVFAEFVRRHGRG